LFDPDHGIRGQPIVCVNNVKCAAEVFRLKDMVNKRTAHIVDLVHKVAIEFETAAMIVDAVYVRVVGLVVTDACENMNLMALPLKSCRKLSNVNADATD
jgi:hypothetical protein